MIDLTDKNLNCDNCGSAFIFTKGEQEFYLKKAFSEPRRCPDCRKTRKKERRKRRKDLLKTLQDIKENPENQKTIKKS